MDETDQELDQMRRSQYLNPQAAAIQRRRRHRNNDLDGDIFSTRMEPDLSDLIKERQGYLEEPNHHQDWDLFRKRLEKLFQRKELTVPEQHNQVLSLEK